MSDFEAHEPCPRCRSRDNVARYDDGHKWCFGCGYYIPPNGIEKIRALQNNNNIEEPKPNGIFLPSDFSHTIEASALEWLKNYGITDDEISKNNIGWTNKYMGLVFPVFGSGGDLLMYQTRHFGSGGLHRSRFFTKGAVESVYHVLRPHGGDQSRICVVEDLPSAIKVSRYCPCMPLWGSTLSPERMRILGRMCDTLLIWLDKDKAKYAINVAKRASFFIKNVRTIVTEKDPKANSDKEIQDEVQNLSGSVR